MTTIDLLMVIKGEVDQLGEAVVTVEQDNFHDPARGYARTTIKKLRADLQTLDRKLKEHEE